LDGAAGAVKLAMPHRYIRLHVNESNRGAAQESIRIVMNDNDETVYYIPMAAIE
jgi:hypothetical protein